MDNLDKLLKQLDTEIKLNRECSTTRMQMVNDMVNGIIRINEANADEHRSVCTALEKSQNMVVSLLDRLAELVKTISELRRENEMLNRVILKSNSSAHVHIDNKQI